ncbi:hypothetical protein JFV26_14540, partial [Pseudomonas sp. TH31]|nr:hypothetical protein [Pseudomonas sp. TH31]
MVCAKLKMNKFFSVVWSFSLGCWVVASEFASRSKQKSTTSSSANSVGRSAKKGLIAISLLGGGVLLAPIGAMGAAPDFNCTELTYVYRCSPTDVRGLEFLANPDGSSYGENMVLSGVSVEDYQVRNYFVGNADTTNTSNIWLGDSGATASTTTIYANKFAFGDASTVANGVNAIAFGVGASSVSDAVAIGTASSALAVNALAFGKSATAQSASAMALGAGSTASNANDVALGAGSVTAAPHAGTSAFYGAAAQGVASAANGVVSVGAAGTERQIQNVAAGVLSATSTDAVNGSQLNSVVTGVNKLGVSTASTLGGATYSATTGQISGFSRPINSVSATGVVGATTAQTSVAGALTALNSDVVNTANIAVKYDALGGNSITLGATGGAGAPAGGVKITNLTAGTLSAASTDAVNGSQLYATNQAVNNIINNGTSTKYFHANSTLADSTATGTDSVAVGPTASASATNSIAVGNGAIASVANSVALGSGATTAAAVANTSGLINGTTYTYAGGAPVGVLSAGAVGSERQVSNVAAGRVSATSTDAVNGSQLFATNTSMSTLGTQTTTLGNTSASTLGGGATYSPATGLTGFSQSINTVSSTGAVGSTTAQTSVAGALTALNSDVVNTANIAVKYDALGGNTITLGAIGGTGTPAGGVKITNLTAGTLSAASTDAVNGAQLYATN